MHGRTMHKIHLLKMFAICALKKHVKSEGGLFLALVQKVMQQLRSEAIVWAMANYCKIVNNSQVDVIIMALGSCRFKAETVYHFKPR